MLQPQPPVLLAGIRCPRRVWECRTLFALGPVFVRGLQYTPGNPESREVVGIPRTHLECFLTWQRNDQFDLLSTSPRSIATRRRRRSRDSITTRPAYAVMHAPLPAHPDSARPPALREVRFDAPKVCQSRLGPVNRHDSSGANRRRASSWDTTRPARESSNPVSTD